MAVISYRTATVSSFADGSIPRRIFPEGLVNASSLKTSHYDFLHLVSLDDG